MALTRDFKETVRARARRDSAFRRALLWEGVLVRGLSEFVPVGLDQAQVGVGGGDGDLELVGDVLEGVAVPAGLVLTLHATASAGWNALRRARVRLSTLERFEWVWCV